LLHNLQRSNADTKFAEQFLERVCTVLHAANDDTVYVEFIRLLNDFGDEKKTPESVPQVQNLSSLSHVTLSFVLVAMQKYELFVAVYMN